MFVVYIIFSEKLNKFYVGTSDNFEERLLEHNSEIKPDSFTLRGRPWDRFLLIDTLESNQAYEIEAHIKRMKSKKYIHDLLKYPEMIEKLKQKYK